MAPHHPHFTSNDQKTRSSPILSREARINRELQVQLVPLAHAMSIALVEVLIVLCRVQRDRPRDRLLQLLLLNH